MRLWPLIVVGASILLALVSSICHNFSPGLDLAAANLGPGAEHWLGTDALGRDVGVMLLVGAKRSILVSVVAGLSGSLLGLMMGSLPVFFGDGNCRLTLRAAVSASLGVILLVYCFLLLWPVAIERRDWLFAWGVPVTGFAVLYLVYHSLSKAGYLNKKIAVPLDTLALRFTELFTVVPRIYMVLAFASVISLNLLSITFLFAITSWATMARLARGEMLKVRALPYIEAARAMGLSEWRVYLKHALPNAISPVATQACFTIASVMVAEATLSFVGIGVSTDNVSWGSLINGYASNLSAWWLAAFPAVAIYTLVIGFHGLAKDLDVAFHNGNV